MTTINAVDNSLTGATGTGSFVGSVNPSLNGLTLTGTLNTNGQNITNSLTNGNVTVSTNGSGLFNLNNTVAIQGVVNDPTFSADSATLVPTQASVKAYVNTIAGTGFTLISSCTVVNVNNFVATYSNGTAGVGATLTQTSAAVVVIDGVTLTLNQRVLFQGQTTSAQNGVYSITTLGTGVVQAVFTRTTDYDTNTEIIPGTLIPILSGTVYAGSIWLETQTVTTVGTDPILFISYAQPSSTFVTLTTNQNITGIKTFNSGSLILKGATSGASILNSAAIAGSTTFTLPGTSDTITGIAATQTLTNKTMDGGSNTFTNLAYTSLANGTEGNLITWNAGGTPTVITPGMAGYVLTSNGAGALPTYQSVSTGLFVTLNTTQTITGAKTFTQQVLATSFAPTSTSGIIGTTTNDNAAAGSVGEYISAALPRANSITLTSSQPTSIVSILLSSGDWDVWGAMQNLFITGHDLSAVVCGTSLVSNTFDTITTGYVTSQTIQGLGAGNNANAQLSAPMRRLSISTTTTIYLTVQLNFTGSMGAYGFIAARRAR